MSQRIWDLRTRLEIDRIDLPSDVKAVPGKQDLSQIGLEISSQSNV